MAQHDFIARAALPRLALLSLCCVLAACSASIDLQNRPVTMPSQAQFGSPSSAVFVDRVVLPQFRKGRIGAAYTPAHAHLRYITTDTDIAKWLQNEWYAFLARHGHHPVEHVDQADYVVDCRINTLRIESISHWADPEQFHAVVDLAMKITDRRAGAVVVDRRWQAHYNTDRSIMSDESDEDIYNHCLSSAFQKALEQIVFAPR
jgi:ABC-type uncharacterized transport system auxiliary subunit